MASSVKLSAATRSGHKGQDTSVADEDVWALLDEAGLGQDVGFMMRTAQLALQEHVLPRLRDLDLTVSQRTIMRLIDARPASRQQQIADALRIKRANLTPLINELVGLGLVARRSSTQGKRANAVHLTVKGKRSLEASSAALQARCCDLEEMLTRTERDQLLRLLRKIVRHLSSLEATA
jgi:DNA-binding MarR family transcriptional regulator